MKNCLNPSCKHPFEPGHYGRRQLICRKVECRNWYKIYWSQTAQPPRGIPEAVYRKIEKSCTGNELFHSLIVAARESAMRKGELLGLTLSDVLDRKGEVLSTIKVRGQWEDGIGFKPTKTNASRIGYFTERARRSIRAWVSMRSNGGETKLAPDLRLWSISESGAWKFFHAVQVALKIESKETGEPYRFHDLRHTALSELVRAGRLDLAQKLGGHRKIETTMRYAERPAEEILSDVEKVRRNGRRRK